MRTSVCWICLLSLGTAASAALALADRELVAARAATAPLTTSGAWLPPLNEGLAADSAPAPVEIHEPDLSWGERSLNSSPPGGDSPRDGFLGDLEAPPSRASPERVRPERVSPERASPEHSGRGAPPCRGERGRGQREPGGLPPEGRRGRGSEGHHGAPPRGRGSEGHHGAPPREGRRGRGSEGHHGAPPREGRRGRGSEGHHGGPPSEGRRGRGAQGRHGGPPPERPPSERGHFEQRRGYDVGRPPPRLGRGEQGAWPHFGPPPCPRCFGPPPCPRCGHEPGQDLERGEEPRPPRSSPRPRSSSQEGGKWW